MSGRSFADFVASHWWKLLAGAIGVGASWALLNAQVRDKADVNDMAREFVDVRAQLERKASQADVTAIMRDVAEMKALMQDMNERQRAFFCRGQPAWCR